jgi:hypothetical protein
MNVSKLDAAKRQLHTAIRLWFADEDPVSIHTLVSAAHEIVHTLFRRKGLNGPLFDHPVIPVEDRPIVGKIITSAAVAFKHARHDPDGITEFDPTSNEILIYTCINGLWRMREPYELYESAFVFRMASSKSPWFMSAFGDRFPPLTEEQWKAFDIPKQAFLEHVKLVWGHPELEAIIAKVRMAAIVA